jgi:hypothetical protein
MKPYANISRDSNIIAYENGADYIIVQFATGYWKTYTYTNTSAGSAVIQHMQRLADGGHGLNSFISDNKPPYVSKH